MTARVPAEGSVLVGVPVRVQVADLDAHPDRALQQVDECYPSRLERSYLELKRVTANRTRHQQEHHQERHGQGAQQQALATSGPRLTDGMCRHAFKTTT